MKKGFRYSLKIIISLFLILILASTIAVSQVNDEYISSPENIPQFDFIKLYENDKGETGEVSFSIENRYTFDMENISLTINIYKFMSGNVIKDINDLNNTPTMTSGSGGDMNSILDDQTIYFQWDLLKNNTLTPVTLNISTTIKTPDGAYFMRMKLIFEYQSKIYIMKSRGHFTQDEWDYAELTAEPTDPGDINLTVLGVHGIIPDSSFHVYFYEPHSFETTIFWIPITTAVFLFCIIFMLIIIFIIYKILKKPKGV